MGQLCLRIGLSRPVDYAYRNPPLDGSAILDADRLFDIASADYHMADMVVKSLGMLVLVGGGGDWVTVLKHGPYKLVRGKYSTTQHNAQLQRCSDDKLDYEQFHDGLCS